MSDDVTTTGPTIGAFGERVRDINVTISYRLLDLFSGHLYQSGSKAIEELVTNAYDAFAENCHVYLQDDDADCIAVYDDGNGMTVDELEDLWAVAESRKASQEVGDRPPIGKFGIGKLATYVLAQNLIHISAKDGKIHAVEMDYTRFPISERIATEAFPIEAREISPEDVTQILASLGRNLPDDWFNVESTWTLAVMTNLKDKAKELTPGRLRWLLGFALPNSPTFRVHLDGARVPAAKEKKPLLKRWLLDETDPYTAKKELETTSPADLDEGLDEIPAEEWEIDQLTDRTNLATVELPDGSKIQGYHEVYRDSLIGGKSEQLISRSHGIFVMVRGRLINENDPLFGLSARSHQTFNRYRIVIHADNIHPHLVASREGIRHGPHLDELQEYIRGCFEAARKWYEEHIYTEDLEQQLTTRVGTLPVGALARPLRNLIRQRTAEPGKVHHLSPETLAAAKENEEFLEEAGIDPSVLVEDVEESDLGFDGPLAQYDLARRAMQVNTSHPFIANFSDREGIKEPLEIIALADIALEGHLAEAGVTEGIIAEVMAQRDRLLREIVSTTPEGAVFVAQRLRDGNSDWRLMERAVHDALKCLGYDGRRISGPGKADGIAIAHLGQFKDDLDKGSYKISYDAKTSHYKKIQSNNLHISVVDTHRKNNGSNYALIVGKDFQTDKIKVHQAEEEARKNNVTLLRTEDLARLVEAKVMKFTSLDTLRDLFATCRTPDECEAWIDDLLAQPIGEIPPVRTLLEVIWDLQKPGNEHVTLGEVRLHEGRLKSYSKQQISKWLAGLHAVIPQIIRHREGTDHVELHKNPQATMLAIQATGDLIPMPEERVESTQ